MGGLEITDMPIMMIPFDESFSLFALDWLFLFLFLVTRSLLGAGGCGMRV